MTLTSIEEALQEQQKGNHAAAIPLFDQAISKAEKHGDANLPKYLNDRGFSHVMSQNYEAAEIDNNRALATSVGAEQRARALIDRSYVERVAHSDIDRARTSLESAIQIAQEGTFFHGKALEFQGRTYLGTDETETMITLFEQADSVYSGLSNPEVSDPNLDRRSAETKHLLGLAVYEAGETERGYELQKEALGLHKKHGNSWGIKNTLTVMGNMDLDSERVDEAILAYKAAQMIQKPGQRGEAQIALGLARAYTAGAQSQVKILDPAVKASSPYDCGMMEEDFMDLNRMTGKLQESVGRIPFSELLSGKSS